METWRELFPNGRMIFYEGDNPEAFRQEIKERFGFDVASSSCRASSEMGWGNSEWSEAGGWSFFCPAEYLDGIYGSGRYPMGS